LDEPEEYIDFMAKYKDWISIRRLGIRPDTKPEEIVQYMAGIRTVIDNKSYPLLGIKTEVIDAYSSKITAGMRKSYDSLSKAIAALGGSETKSVLDSACENKDLKPLAEVYLLGKTITGLGFDSGINQAIMAKIFPYLKISKPLGRKKSKKQDEEV
jgi:hypothetical protein